MICPACGSSTNKPDAKFCRECGHGLTPQLREEASVCPGCGTVNKPGNKFCRSCGAALQGVSDTAIAAVAAITEILEPCPSCGKPNSPGRRFCKHCGSEILATSVEKSAEKISSLENPPNEPVSGDESTVIPVVAAPSEISREEAVPPETEQEAKTEAAQIEQPAKPPQVVLPDTPGTPGTLDKGHAETSGGSKTQVNVRLVASLAGILLLAGGGGAYMWWQQSPPQASMQEPLQTQDDGIAPIPMVPNVAAVPQLSKEQETSPPPPTEIAEATVDPHINTASLPQPAIRPIQPVAQDTKPAPIPTPTSATSRQAATKVRQAEPEFPQEFAPTPTRQQEKRPVLADAQPAGVPEIVARECASLGGFKRIVCEEQVRMKLCTGKWGTVPGCPKYEHEDPFKF